MTLELTALQAEAVTPEEAGFSSARLQRLDDAMRRLVDDGKPVPVNPGETGRLDNYSSGVTSVGLLIHAAPGSRGGIGGWRTKRSG